MSLERWIALLLLCVCLVYGYTAWFTMDNALAPFMQRNPVWPSTFPKVLSLLGVAASTLLLLGVESNGNKQVANRKDDSADTTAQPATTDYANFKWGQATALIVLMATYAIALRPLGFLLSTVTFLVVGSLVLGERKLYLLIPVAASATGIVWYLVHQVLGIYLSPLPLAMMR